MVFELTTLVVIGTDCIGSCKSNCHTITTTDGTYTNLFVFYDKYINDIDFFVAETACSIKTSSGRSYIFNDVHTVLSDLKICCNLYVTHQMPYKLHGSFSNFSLHF